MVKKNAKYIPGRTAKYLDILEGVNVSKRRAEILYRGVGGPFHQEFSVSLFPYESDTIFHERVAGSAKITKRVERISWLEDRIGFVWE